MDLNELARTEIMTGRKLLIENPTDKEETDKHANGQTKRQIDDLLERTKVKSSGFVYFPSSISDPVSVCLSRLHPRKYSHKRFYPIGLA